MATVDELRAEANMVERESGEEYTTREALMHWACDEITRLRQALRRVGNINAEGTCYEVPDNNKGCVRCRIAMAIIEAETEETNG